MSQNLEDGGVLPASKGPMSSLGPPSGTSMSEMRAAERASEEYNLPLFAQRYMVDPINANKFPDRTMPARAVQRMIRNHRQLDATPRLNLASFVTTWMEPECDELMHEARNVNFIDESEYPSCTEIHNNCVAMLADLFHAEGVCGTGTVGSSEAILLAGLAMKRRWSEKRKAAGKPPAQCNMVCGSEVHVVWEKLFNYIDIEPRYVNITEGHVLPKPEDLAARCDENTIGVVGILGTTYTGNYEDIEGIDKAVGEVNEKNGWEIGVHVDGASGAFVVPFLFPELKFDFRLKNVVSINASGHKYGLTYPGVGWCIFRSRDYLPDSLVFHDNYLGTDQLNFTLNFSKGASQIICQYYQFLRLGRVGYAAVMRNCWEVSNYLADRIDKLGYFKILSARAPNPGLPTVVFTLLPEMREKGFDEFIIADHLRQRGWVVPAYTLAPNAVHVKVLRVLCREDLGISGASSFADDVERAIKWLNSHVMQTPEQAKLLKTALKWKVTSHALARLKGKPLEQVPMEALTKAHGGVC